MSVPHSLHIRDEFLRAGIRGEHVDGSTPKSDRDAALKRVESGETQVITNCGVLVEGWDLPAVSCCILARPTRQMGLYRQMVGRVLRPAPGKVDAVVLDHSGAVFRHGFVEDHVKWTLDPDKRAESPTHAARLAAGNRSRMLQCLRCGAIRTAGEACKHCGFFPQRRPDAIAFDDGNLALVDRGRRIATNTFDPEERAHWHGMLTFIARSRGYKPGWVFHKYVARFRDRPTAYSVNPIPPTPEVWSWVRSQQIRFAKAREKAKAS